jgi:hypothetical protein
LIQKTQRKLGFFMAEGRDFRQLRFGCESCAGQLYCFSANRPDAELASF